MKFKVINLYDKSFKNKILKIISQIEKNNKNLIKPEKLNEYFVDFVPNRCKNFFNFLKKKLNI